MIKPELLRTFVRVTELSSFTQAGEQLGLPRSSASEQVRQLEDLLGTRLLQRTTRKVRATQDGLVFYERSKALLAQMDELQGLFRRDGEVLAGRLRVDMPTIVARKVVMPRLGEFTARHPGLELEVSSTDRRVDLVREGFDCVLRVGEPQDSDMVARRVARLGQVTCASAAYVAQYGLPCTLEELAGHRMIGFRSSLTGGLLPLEFVQDGVVRNVVLPAQVSMSGSDSFATACRLGLGIIQVPRYRLAEDLAQGTLVELLPQWQPPALPVSLLYPRSRQLSPRVRVFLDWVTREFATKAGDTALPDIPEAG
ncbi:MAG: LysR family transcriptional regulator [Cupriavidus sp.]|nr:MAG: LysR family transcriptional regulator [Cupriavidus sp.]